MESAQVALAWVVAEAAIAVAIVAVAMSVVESLPLADNLDSSRVSDRPNGLC